MLPTPPVLPFYSEKEIDDIIEVVRRFPSETMLYLRPDYLHSAADGGYGPVEKSRRWTLEDGIQYAAKVYIGDRHFDKPTTDLELRRQYKNAISLCEVLVKTLYEQRARLFAGLVPSNTEEPECRSVQQIIADLSQLQKWLAWRASHIRPSKKSGHGGSRRKSLASFDLWVRHLADIYHYVFELDPGFSVGAATQDTGGPFARYLDACIRPILGDETPSLGALRSPFRRLQGNGHFKS